MTIDRFRAMEVFTRVVDLGSFTRAAEALQLPKARVTTLVQELEAHLGVRLLHRTTRRLRLTDDGALYQRRALALLQQIAELEGELDRAVAMPAGRLRADVPAAAGRHLIAPALPDFFRRYPRMVIELGSSDRPVDLIAEGVDCVIRGGEVYDESLVALPLGRLAVVTCAAPSYLEGFGTPATPAALDGHMFVNFFSPKTGRVFPFEFTQDGQTQCVTRPHWVSTNDTDTYVAAGVAGMGLMQTPLNRVVCEHLANGRLLQVLADWSSGSLPLVLMYQRDRHPSAKLRAFIDWASELFRARSGEAAPADGRGVQRAV